MLGAQATRVFAGINAPRQGILPRRIRRLATSISAERIASADGRAAVDDHRLAGHEVACGRAEEDGRAGDFIRNADAQQR